MKRPGTAPCERSRPGSISSPRSASSESYPAVGRGQGAAVAAVVEGDRVGEEPTRRGPVETAAGGMSVGAGLDADEEGYLPGGVDGDGLGGHGPGDGLLPDQPAIVL